MQETLKRALGEILQKDMPDHLGPYLVWQTNAGPNEGACIDIASVANFRFVQPTHVHDDEMFAVVFEATFRIMAAGFSRNREEALEKGVFAFLAALRHLQRRQHLDDKHDSSLFTSHTYPGLGQKMEITFSLQSFALKDLQKRGESPQDICYMLKAEIEGQVKIFLRDEEPYGRMWHVETQLSLAKAREI